ncbi:MAG: hypothetical protein AAF809_04500 [Bacteroidota bacterium]
MTINDRIMGAALFGGAAALFWLAAWGATGFAELVAYGAGASIPSACLFGALDARRVILKALGGTDLGNGFAAGMGTTVKAYALTALLIAAFFASLDPIRLLMSDPMAFLAGLPEALLFFLGILVIAALAGLQFLLPSLAVGAGAGWLFHRYAMQQYPSDLS